LAKAVETVSSENPKSPDLAIYWVFSRLIAARVALLVSTVAALVLAILYLSLAEKWFSAETVLIPAERAPAGVNAQLGGLAALAGVNISRGGNTAEATALLKSRGLLRDFIIENKLVSVIGEPNSALSDSELLEKTVSYFDKSLRSISEDRRAGTITLTVKWSDPSLAAAWANGLVVKANSQLRGRALQAAESNAEFLRSELSKTNSPALQQSLSRLLESEMQTALLAKSGDGFGFKVVDFAVPPERQYWPVAAVVLLLALFVALLATVLIIVIREYRSNHLYHSPGNSSLDR
jgi:uncharacterized protein involved in exopolysaccharide biosynthesis